FVVDFVYDARFIARLCIGQLPLDTGQVFLDDVQLLFAGEDVVIAFTHFHHRVDGAVFRVQGISLPDVPRCFRRLHQARVQQLLVGLEHHGTGVVLPHGDDLVADDCGGYFNIVVVGAGGAD